MNLVPTHKSSSYVCNKNRCMNPYVIPLYESCTYVIPLKLKSKLVYISPNKWNCICDWKLD